MTFKAWEARRHIETKYKTALHKLGRFLLDQIGEGDTVEAIASKLDNLGNSEAFTDWAQSLARTFVTNTLEENAKTWRQAARMSGQGQEINAMLQRELSGPVGDLVRAMIDDNAKYIKSVPQDVAQRLTNHVASQAQSGSRTAYKTTEFKEYVGNMSDWHAKLISRTESAKAMSALTQARAEYTGHDWGIWHTAEDGRVRKSHKKMDDVLFRFSDKPAPEELVGEKSAGHYGPGEIYNCRCYAEPVILWSAVKWPMRVYAGGSITTISNLRDFKEKFGG